MGRLSIYPESSYKKARPRIDVSAAALAPPGAAALAGGAELRGFAGPGDLPIPLLLGGAISPWSEVDTVLDHRERALLEPLVLTAENFLSQPVRGVVGVFEEPVEQLLDTESRLTAEDVRHAHRLLIATASCE